MIRGGDSTRVLLAMWLPAGKDEFGFARYEEAPLFGTARYKLEYERTISDHLLENLSSYSENDTRLAGMQISGDLNPADADLGLRMISYQFKYRPTLKGTDVPLEVGGDGIILSNGLYMWSFDYPHRSGIDQEALREAVKKFLKMDFFPKHINELFNFSWPSTVRPDLGDYRGALTYYQLDLLFNGMFDNSAYSHGFLSQVSEFDRGGHVDGNLKGIIEYSVEKILKSGALFAMNDIYLPLFDERKDFSYRGPGARPPMKGRARATSQDTDAVRGRTGRHRPFRGHGAAGSVGLAGGRRRGARSGVDASSSDEAIYIDLQKTASEILADYRDKTATQMLLSRLTFACMEQFLRVAVSFGTIHYRAGLDHCRAQLTSDALQLRVSRSSGEMIRPSLANIETSLAAIDSYSTVMAGKIPTLLFIKDLVEDLIEDSTPSNLTEGHKLNGNGGDEWRYSRKTLQEALLQYDRQVDAIRADVMAIDRNLEAVRSDQVIAELVETRKLAELETESPRVFFLQTDNIFITRLTQIALILATVQVYSAIGVWIMERVTSEEGFWRSGFSVGKLFGAFGHWIIISGVVVFYAVRLIRRPSRESNEEADKTNKIQSHVFDYSFLREPITGISATQIKEIAGAMPALSRDGDTLPSVSFSSFRETPSSGVERTKYTLEAVTGKDRCNYLLHAEIDRRITGSDDEFLRDIRLVVRVPLLAKPNFDVQHAAQAVIVNSVKKLVLVGKSQDEVSRFFLKNFGWSHVS